MACPRPKPESPQPMPNSAAPKINRPRRRSWPDHAPQRRARGRGRRAASSIGLVALVSYISARSPRPFQPRARPTAPNAARSPPSSIARPSSSTAAAADGTRAPMPPARRRRSPWRRRRREALRRSPRTDGGLEPAVAVSTGTAIYGSVLTRGAGCHLRGALARGGRRLSFSDNRACMAASARARAEASKQHDFGSSSTAWQARSTSTLGA